MRELYVPSTRFSYPVILANSPPIMSCLYVPLVGKLGYSIARAMAWCVRVLIVSVLTIFKQVTGHHHHIWPKPPNEDANYCLSWRMAVEANNVRPWRTVPAQCSQYIETYMVGGQYKQDIDFITGQVMSYVSEIDLIGDGMDAWILDVDDTCISNVFYYRDRRYGCDPYDPASFRTWALQGGCPAIPAVQELFNKLVESGFKVFMVTGRDQATLGLATLDNLQDQGFQGFERLIMRTPQNKGQGAIAYKSTVRKQLVEEGYRIWGNVGDQWSDLQGECVGNKTFKLPNPMYYVP